MVTLGETAIATTVEDNATEQRDNADAEVEGQVVTFTDTAIEKYIRDYLGLGYDQPITDVMCGRITNIYFVGDRYNTVKTLDDLNLFPNLESLYIDNAGQQMLNLQGLENADNLKFLSLITCKISYFNRIAELSNLEYLYISDVSNPIEDISSISCLDKLRSLYLFTQVETGGMSINELENLEELVLGDASWYGYQVSTSIDLFPI